MPIPVVRGRFGFEYPEGYFVTGNNRAYPAYCRFEPRMVETSYILNGRRTDYWNRYFRTPFPVISNQIKKCIIRFEDTTHACTSD